jgi:MFS family permease
MNLRPVASLISAVTVLQIALGMLGVHLPLAMQTDGLSAVSIGIVGSLYALGFMGGAWWGPTLLSRVGYIRVFAVSAAVTAATVLALYGANDIISWSMLRGITGAAVAFLFVSVDAWISGSIGKEDRGGVIGVYQVVTKLGLAVGPFLLLVAPADEAAALMIAGGLCAIALVPIGLTSQAQPPAPLPKPLALREQFDTAPAAVLAAFFAGFVNGGVLLLSPVYAGAAFGAEQATAFQSAAWLGSLLLQWPAGRLSDRTDRRVVILGLTAIASAAAFALAALGVNIPFWGAAALFAIWGAGGLSYYGIAIAHMADRAEPAFMAQAASGLLFVWGIGSILGPPTVGTIVDLAGPSGLFWFAGASGLVLAALMVERRRSRQKVAPAQKENFAPQPTTSVAVAEIAYGPDDASR